MTKPNDIPQDVWDAADDMSAEWLMPGGEGHALATNDIARAIMAEREACAKRLELVDGYFNPPPGLFEALYRRTDRDDEFDPFWQFRGDTGNWSVLIHEILAPYAAAIRQR